MQADLKKALSWDYSFIQKHLPVMGNVFSCLVIFFYLMIVYGMQNQDTLFLRILAAVMFVGFNFLPKLSPLKFYHKLYIECAVVLATLVIIFDLYVVNNGTFYWGMSILFCGLTVGVFCNFFTGMAYYVCVAVAIYFLHFEKFSGSPEFAQDYILLQIVGFTLYIISSTVQIAYKINYYKMLDLQVRIIRQDQINRNLEKMKAREEVIRQYVRPSILVEVALGKNPSLYEPKLKNMSILFVDMRNYTNFIEQYDFKIAYEVLNKFFDKINHAVFKHGGEVDKIIGDGVMSVFNDPNDCLDACREMQRQLVLENRQRYGLGRDLVGFGIGVSSGKVMAANFGGSIKIDRTVIGDAVNESSRLEQLTKSYSVQTLVAGRVLEQVSDKSKIRKIDRIKIKGKTDETDIYELYEGNHPEVVAFKDFTAPFLDKIFALLQRAEFKCSLEILDYLIDDMPNHVYQQHSKMDPCLIRLKHKILELEADRRSNPVLAG